MMNFHLARYLIGLLVLIGHFFSIGFYLYLVRTIVPNPAPNLYLDGIAADDIKQHGVSHHQIVC